MNQRVAALVRADVNLGRASVTPGRFGRRRTCAPLTRLAATDGPVVMLMPAA